MTLQEILASILNPNGMQQQNQLSMAGAPTQVGDHHDPAVLWQAQQRLAQPQAMRAPQMPQQRPQQAQPQPATPPQLKQGAPAPESAPQRAPEANGGRFGGIGDFLQSIIAPQSAQKNVTIGWLQKQGLDQGTATLLAGSKPALQQYLLQRSQGKKPIEINGRLVDPDTYQVLADFSDPKAKYNFITGRDGSIFRADETEGSLSQVYGGKPDQPTDVQEYEYAKNQGYQGTFQQFQIEQKKAGASQVNIDQKAEGAFDKKLAENQATIFTEMATEGLNAKADLAVLGELEGLLGQTGGTLSGVSGALAKYGIGGAGMSDIQAAQALINKLVPTQRQPGSGTMSDRDVELFTRSLPSLWNAPGGNQKILSVMRGLAQYKQTQGEIATAVMNGQMSRQDAAKALQSIPNPLAGFKASAAQSKAAPPIGETRAPGADIGPSRVYNPNPPVKDWKEWFKKGQ
ncbi:MAG: hypothetical protein E5V27_04635 [Mesorhizobium sp.]|nr:MAG: hypothetical protein E5V27_04635 [Mesorhizobium sp.]